MTKPTDFCFENMKCRQVKLPPFFFFVTNLFFFIRWNGLYCERCNFRHEHNPSSSGNILYGAGGEVRAEIKNMADPFRYPEWRNFAILAPFP